MNKIQSARAFNIAVAICLSLVLWLYVINVENPTGDALYRNVPITLQGEDVLEEAGLMVTDLDRETLRITATGRRKTLMLISKEQIQITADVSAITQPGQWNITCQRTLRGGASESAVTFSEQNDYVITVTVEKRASKEVPVQGEYRGTIQPGYEADPILLDPAVIEVTGPEEIIAQIDHAAVILQGEALSQSMEVDMPLTLADADGVVIPTEDLRLSADQIHATLPVVQVFEVPLGVEFIEGGGATAGDAVATITPQTVRVSGEDAAQLDELVIGQVDLAQVFTIRNFTFPIQVPEGVTLRSEQTQASVQITLQDVPMRSTATTNITLINAPRGWQATLVAPSMQVWVRGSQEALDALTGDQIQVTVDLTDIRLAAGQQRMEVEIALVDAPGVGVVGSDYSVAVNLSR